jgi:hypothetical protein
LITTKTVLFYGLLRFCFLCQLEPRLLPPYQLLRACKTITCPRLGTLYGYTVEEEFQFKKFDSLLS